MNKSFPLLTKIKSMGEGHKFFLFECMIMLMLCFLHAMSAGHYADFFAMNGTFQNYNPVRRLLSGQIPYKDFQDYLGIGHLYIGSFVTMLLGGNYRRSLIAFSFLTILGFVLNGIVLGLALFRHKNITLAVNNSILILLLTQTLLLVDGTEGTGDIRYALNSALDSGNSARFIRGMILPLVCIMIWSGYKIYKKAAIKKPWICGYNFHIKYCGIGFIAGFAFIWSNDYGISCWFCLFVMTIIYSLAREKGKIRVLKAVVLELFVSFMSVFILVEVLTFGNFRRWFCSTFGVGGYQAWYYNSSKSFFIFDIDFSYIVLLQAFICLGYMVKLFIAKGNKEALIRYGVPGFANMVSFCAVNEYKLLSGGSLREVALSVLFFSSLFEVCRYVIYLDKQKKLQKMLMSIAAITGCAWIVSTGKNEFIFSKVDEKAGEYIPQMGGYMTELGDDLTNASNFLNGNSFFSTYASAQEVMENIYQPSGTDYIIHVLGDEQREEYLADFEEGDFAYAATIKPTYTDWEYWVQRANWFFYRELYKKWHPVYSNTYATYWERNELNDSVKTPNKNYKVEIEIIDESTQKLVIETDKDINGMADVYIDYAVKKNKRKISKLLFQSFLKVENTGTLYAEDPYYESNYLRTCGQEYIPISIVNGYGEVTLTSSPEIATCLEIYNAICHNIYAVMYDYVEASAVNEDGDGAVVVIANNAFHWHVVEGIQGVVIDKKEIDILEITSDDESIYLKINSDNNIEDFNKALLEIGNMLEVVK